MCHRLDTSDVVVMENASICQECHVAKWAIGLRLANQSMNKPTVLTLTTNDHNHWCLLLHTIEWHTFTAIDQTDTCQWEVSDCVPKLSSVPALTKCEHTPQHNCGCHLKMFANQYHFVDLDWLGQFEAIFIVDWYFALTHFRSRYVNALPSLLWISNVKRNYRSG